MSRLNGTGDPWMINLGQTSVVPAWGGIGPRTYVEGALDPYDMLGPSMVWSGEEEALGDLGVREAAGRVLGTALGAFLVGAAAGAAVAWGLGR